MIRGKVYPRAHMGATIVEDYFRYHPKELGARIAEEAKKQ